MRGDELHQLWVQGRGGQWSDVLLDSSGVVFGIGLFMLMQSMRKFFRKAATLMVCCLLCGGGCQSGAAASSFGRAGYPGY